ncbi:MAG: N-acetyl-gamma-glutamyl-phosphate reductase [Phycisphaerae bacterium]|nr:N-acetyl-gamma-glutamyl-phosphate reductase [Phycisphaerae bacterium]
MKKINVVLVGGSGYTGFEIIRILLRHPHAQLVASCGESQFGPLETIHPHFAKCVDLVQEAFDADRIAAHKPDVAILCAPHKVAMQYVPQLRAKGIRCVDLSADYRLKDQALYEKWYCPHTDGAGLAEAVYGLPEFYADAIRTAGLVANPGCYPTSATLPLAPLLRTGLIEPTGIIVNAASGVSGAGKSPSQKNHYPERNENYEAYGVGNHRHTPEIEANLTALLAGTAMAGMKVDLIFQPHLVPMDRGILSTIYATPAKPANVEELTQCLQAAYADKPFVRVRTGDTLPATKYVANTNFCDIAARVVKGNVVLFGALDNMLKGASSQAIQNMNLMFGFDETAGLF